MQSENTDSLSAALCKAQAAMKAAVYNKTNPHFKNRYADLASVIDATRKPLADNGLSTTQTTEIREGGFVLVTTLRHTSGQWVASEYPLPAGAKPQELGSALTYARRYSLSAITCIAADEDDDAEGAHQAGQTSSTPKAKTNSTPINPSPPTAPVNPETGEVSPHRINEDDMMKWGGLFVAAIGLAQSADEIRAWHDANAEGLEKLGKSAPKVLDRVNSRVTEKLNSFKKEAA